MALAEFSWKVTASGSQNGTGQENVSNTLKALIEPPQYCVSRR